MADRKFLPPEPVLPEVRGGRTRPSVEVDVSEFPAVALRRKLNERLLDAACAFDGPARPQAFDPEDLDLLLLVAGERFDGDGALLRRRAVAALGTIDAGEAVRRLVDLAVAPVEHDQIRISALAALPREQATDVFRQLVDDPSAAVREFVRRASGGERNERRKVPGQVPVDGTRGPGEPEDRCSPCC